MKPSASRPSSPAPVRRTSASGAGQFLLDERGCVPAAARRRAAVPPGAACGAAAACPVLPRAAGSAATAPAGRSPAARRPGRSAVPRRRPGSSAAGGCRSLAMPAGINGRPIMYWTRIGRRSTLRPPCRFEPSAGGGRRARRRAPRRAAVQPSALPARLGHILSLDDFERPRAATCRPGVRVHLRRGRAQPLAARQRAAFERYEFVPRCWSTSRGAPPPPPLLGKRYSAPFGMAPMGISALSAYRGDLVLAQAAARENVPMIMSGSSLIRLEESCRPIPTPGSRPTCPATRPTSSP
jgi:hypothetical protein